MLPGMADILLIGSGLGGLSAATLLARDGHQVTVLERDPAPPPAVERAADAWDGWLRPGVNQFRLPHLMLPRWWAQMQAEAPELWPLLRAAGARRFNTVTSLPEKARGPVLDGDDRFEALAARRPVLETAMAAVAEAAGATIRRGVTVTGLTTDRHPRVPRVTGVLTDRGWAVPADLVVDCGGRRSPLRSWLTAVGARPPAEEREDSGFVYYGRHFRGRTGELPAVHGPLVQNHDSVTVLTLPADGGTWSVVLTTSSRDKALRALRDPATWHAVLRRYPLAAHWTDAEPISGVDVMAGLEDRRRSLVVDGEPVATGVLALADAWACTNPSVGRGASMAVLHAGLLRDLLRETDPADHEKLARRFHELTEQVAEPLFRSTRWYDRHRLAEIEADIAGQPYRPADPGWAAVKALATAALTDPDLLRQYASINGFLATGPEVFARPGVLDRTFALGGDGPQYPLPGPGRAELLATIRG
jgi:2-polyprenyl-6-methoxyphenol hydroxylase-like FAD-dependent oxidoreductase